jgi:hypothetical protein
LCSQFLSNYRMRFEYNVVLNIVRLSTMAFQYLRTTPLLVARFANISACAAEGSGRPTTGRGLRQANNNWELMRPSPPDQGDSNAHYVRCPSMSDCHCPDPGDPFLPRPPPPSPPIPYICTSMASPAAAFAIHFSFQPYTLPFDMTELHETIAWQRRKR